MSWKQKTLQVVTLVFMAVLVAAPLERAQASRSCLPDFTALTAVKFLMGTPEDEFIYPLFSENQSGRFQAHVELVGSFEPDSKSQPQLNLKFRFSDLSPELSLPVNIYAVLVIFNDAPMLWLDLTSECVDPGVSFFPGQEFSLPTVQDLPLLGEVGRLQIIVWAKI